MTDVEVFELAASVTSTITKDLSEGIYVQLRGSLTMTWSTSPRFNASAHSLGPSSEPPRHKIVLNYELARQLYRDTEYYLEFVDNFHDDKLLPLFQGLDFAPNVPRYFSHKERAANMFIGALTWVYFHEIGHLWQEHGEIRRQFGDLGEKAELIEECLAESEEQLTGRDAALWHATELAADFHATSTCLFELIRHFASDAIRGKAQDLQPFRAAVYLLTCGISCACYRFYGLRPTDSLPHPVGSHPTPIRRLEVVIPQLFEFLDNGGAFGMDRRELILLCSGAAYSCGFYFLGWLKSPEVPENYMLKGLLNDPSGPSYWKVIVDVWDEIEPRIRQIRRSAIELGMLRFASDFRSKVLKPEAR